MTNGPRRLAGPLAINGGKPYGESTGNAGLFVTHCGDAFNTRPNKKGAK